MLVLDIARVYGLMTARPRLATAARPSWHAEVHHHASHGTHHNHLAGGISEDMVLSLARQSDAVVQVAEITLHRAPPCNTGDKRHSRSQPIQRETLRRPTTAPTVTPRAHAADVRKRLARDKVVHY
ncbi:hypothetical protein VTO73DRAFT_6109 [Trametes versicolor]